MKKMQNDLGNKRREFLKKSIYAAPAIVLLGSLNVHANDPTDPACSCLQNGNLGTGNNNGNGRGGNN